jgi:hypothetical protein
MSAHTPSSSPHCSLLVVVVSCAANNETLKSVFAPDFGTATEAQLQDGMWRLGYATQDLDAAIKAQGVDDRRHAAILESLDLMAAAAASVGKPGQPRSTRTSP